MVWDDELDTLTSEVLKAFGGDAVAEAYTRAFSAAPALPDGASIVKALLGEELAAHNIRTKLADGRVTADCFKLELRQLLSKQSGSARGTCVGAEPACLR